MLFPCTKHTDCVVVPERSSCPVCEMEEMIAKLEGDVVDLEDERDAYAEQVSNLESDLKDSQNEVSRLT